MAIMLPDKLKYQPSRWMTEIYPERGEDITKELVSYYFWERWKDKEDELADVYVLDRAMAEAHFDAVENASDLEMATHQATMYLIYNISEKDWHKYGEYDDLVMLLQDKLQGYEERAEERGADDLPGSYYELNGLMDTVQYLEQLGVPKEKVLGIRHNISKAREAQKVMKKVREADISDKEKKESLEEILEDVVNPRVSLREYRRKNKNRSIQQAKALPAMQGSIYLVQGMELAVIESPDSGSTKAIELSLNGLVDGWGIRDGARLIQYLTEKVYTKGKFRESRIIYTDTNKPYFKMGDGGYPMPTPNHLKTIIMEKLGADQLLIEQVLEGSDICWLPLYNITNNIKQSELKSWITNSFKFRVREERTPYQTLKMAIEDYVLPEDIARYYDYPCSIQLTFRKRWLNIDLRIERIA
jgi:hypothetical protein